MIQRAFSSFPDSWPGAGLLLFRIATGVPLLVNGPWALFPGKESVGALYRITDLSSGSLILVGLWTPVAAVAQALLQGAVAVAGHDSLLHASAAFLGLSLALLGPGAWSVDARLYGRKRIRT